MHLCHIFFSLYEKTFADSDDREYTASRWHSSSAGSRRPANALNDLCKDCPIQFLQVKVHGFPISQGG
ncbi:hypothetical protein L210DRAFT_3575611 [Boletus edulis BED1]|uniref:Uncharacterized protein n=1 Tax=Boletus edulis BED1 TaxID=1328754 RepID=A0AAD4BDC9_BOLED|nr:hypothetical protein L210DRAFT_3575611 [Boletus edulis BED1]